MPEIDRSPAPGYVWRPSEAFRNATNWQSFMRTEGVADYPELERKARENQDWFWSALLRFLDVRFRRPWTSVLDVSEGLGWPKRCVGAPMNMTDTLLDRHVPAGRGGHEALGGEGKAGATLYM